MPTRNDVEAECHCWFVQQCGKTTQVASFWSGTLLLRGVSPSCQRRLASRESQYWTSVRPPGFRVSRCSPGMTCRPSTPYLSCGGLRSAVPQAKELG